MIRFLFTRLPVSLLLLGIFLPMWNMTQMIR